MYDVAELLRHQTRVAPGAPFLRFDTADGEQASLTFGEVGARVQRLAARIRSAGAQPGARVAISCADPVSYAVAILACWEAAAVAVPIHRELPPSERRDIVTLAGAGLLLSDDAEPSGIEPGVATLRPDDGAGAPEAPPSSPGPRVDPRAPAEILFTSGSSGSPKGVVLSHENLLCNAIESVDSLGLRSSDVQYCAVALSHAYGQNRGLLSTLYAGASLFAETSADPAARIRHIQALRPTILLSVPGLYLVLLALRPDLSFVRAALSGAAPLAPHIPRAFEEVFGVPLLVAYGMTECGPLIASQRCDGERLSGSVGTPIRGVELRVVDDAGHPLASGEAGELVVRGPNVMLGYDGALGQHLDTGGWFHTGDLARLDEHGRVFLTGRLSSFVKRSGYKVFPAEVQSALLEHAEVLDALVVTVSHPITGEDLEGMVVVKPGSGLTDDALIAHCARALPPHKRLTRVRIVGEIPRLPSGKPGVRA